MISAITYPSYCCPYENLVLARASSTITQTVCEAITSSSVLAGVSTVPGPSIFSPRGVCLQPCLQHCALHLPLLWLPLALAMPAQPHVLLSTSCHSLIHLQIVPKLPVCFFTVLIFYMISKPFVSAFSRGCCLSFSLWLLKSLHALCVPQLFNSIVPQTPFSLSCHCGSWLHLGEKPNPTQQ